MSLESLINETKEFKEVQLPGGEVRQRIFEDGVYREEDLEIWPEDIDLAIYYSGLAVLSRDMHLYLVESPGEDTTSFEEVVSSVMAIDQKLYHKSAFPYTSPDFPLKDALTHIPRGMAESAAKGTPTIRQLGNSVIVHEFTFKVGKRFFDKFKLKFKETICGKGGPYEQFNNNLVGKAALPSTIAGAILVGGFSVATFWYPLAVYIAILLIKAGLKTYCEP
jgi:hypothetical protein